MTSTERRTTQTLCHIRSALRVISGLFLACGIGFCAQVPGGQRTKDVLSPEQIKTTLLRGTNAKQAALARELRLVIPKWTRWGATKDLTCTEIDAVDTNYVTLQRPGPQAVIQIRSGRCQYTFLVILERTKGGTWRYLQTIPLWAKDREPRITFESLVSPDTKEIVARDVETDYGTGMFQMNLTIFKMFQGRLDVVLDEPDQVVFAVASNEKQQWNTDQHQESEYRIVSPEEGEQITGLKEISQKQVIRDHETTIIRWWRYVWIPEIRRFQAYPASE